MDNFKPQAKVWFVAAWFAASTTALIFSVVFSVYLSTAKVVKPSVQNFKLYAALPETENSISDEIVFIDARAKIIEDFFKEYKSPLAQNSSTFVKISDKYQLDWRLLPSIAMQESNGGKRVIKDSYNPFGYGVYGKLVIKFQSWDEAIERVGRTLREDYLNKGLKNPTQIMAKYTPPSLAKGGAWAKGVSSFMEELQ
ncbi:glucosaminidase domain-containing protein [Candidatus Daviesbacteria bacterium]|nr:glucosaminidase domain-containing protein [Candidatus Daviesbacteria bacterium]